MELRQLEHFLVVARTLSFTKAAAELFVVQSAVSQQIGRLEEELGVRLFERTSRRVTLTEAGEILRLRAEAVLRMTQDIQGEMGQLAGVVGGSLRLGISPGVDSAVELADLLSSFRRIFPAVRLVVRDNRIPQMLEKVLTGEVDVAFVAQGAHDLPTGLSGVALGTEHLVAVVHPGHPLAGRRDTSLPELADAGPFVDPSPETRLRATVDKAWSASGVTRTTTLEVVEVGMLVRYAAIGLGAALVPASSLRYLAPPDGQEGFSTIALRDPIEYPVTCVYHSPGPSSPAAREFLSLLAKSDIGTDHARRSLGNAAAQGR